MRTIWTVEKDAVVFDHFDYLIDDMTEIVWRDLNAERLNFGHTAQAMHTVVTKAAPDIEEINDRAEEWAKSNAGKLVTHVTVEQQKAIQRITTRALQSGLSTAETAGMVKKAIGLTPRWVEAVENFRQGLIAKGTPPGDARRQANGYADRLRMSRARQIAATELQSALNMGQLLSWEDAVKDGELPSTVQRKFVVHKDERLCEKCRPLHGQIIGIGQNWKVQKQTFLTPPIHPNCRCSEVLVGKSLRGRRKNKDRDDDRNEKWRNETPGRPDIPAPTSEAFRAVGALKVGSRVHLADAPETDPDGTVTAIAGDRVRVRWDDAGVSWHIPGELTAPTGQWDFGATPEEIKKHGTKGRPGYRLLHPGADSQATGKRATALNVWQGTFDACDRIQDNAECILARKPMVDNTELTGRKWSTMRSPEAAQIILDSLYQDDIPQADYGMITANPQKYAANPVKYRGNLWRGMRFTVGERDQFLEDARRGAPMLVSLASFALDRSVAEGYSNDTGVVVQVESEDTPILPTPDFPTQDVVTTGRFVPVEITEGNPSLVRMRWEGMVASLSKDDIEFSKWSRHFARPQIEAVEKHGTKGRPGYRLLHPGTGYGRGENFDVDRFIKDNPQRKDELIFEWHSRIIATLDPDTKNRVIFKVRERYEPVDFVAKGAARWRRENGLPEPKVDISEVMADIEKGDKVGRFWEDTPDRSNDPEVIAAYEDFKRQNEEMYDFITRPESEGGLGITVEIVKDPDGEPYDSAQQQADDVRNNRHFAVQTGLGGNHPLMTTNEYDRFRAVHDIFGHVGIGRGFDRHGEYQAWLSHVSMYRRPGRDAMSSEYHAVNSALWSGDPNNPGGTGKAVLLPLELMDPFDSEGNMIRKAQKFDDDEIDYFIKRVGLTTEFIIQSERNAWHAKQERIIKHGNKGAPGYHLLHPGSAGVTLRDHMRFFTAKHQALMLQKAKEFGFNSEIAIHRMLALAERNKNAERDSRWYYVRREEHEALAQATGEPLASVAGVTAAFSPLNFWKKNWQDSQKMMDAWHRNIPITITEKDRDGVLAYDAGKKNPVDLTSSIGTNPLRDIPPEHAAAVSAIRNIGLPKGFGARKKIIDSLHILHGKGDEKVIDKWIDGPKTSSFFTNIMNPDDRDVITVDTHMIRAMMDDVMLPDNQFKKLVSQPGAKEESGFDIDIGLYPLMADAVAEAAMIDGRFSPSEFQAVVWSQWIDEHPANERSTLTKRIKAAAKAKLAGQKKKVTRRRKKAT